MQRLTIIAAALALVAPIFAADDAAMFAKHWQTSKEFTLAVAEGGQTVLTLLDANFATTPATVASIVNTAHCTYQGGFSAISVSMAAPERPPRIINMRCGIWATSADTESE